MAKGETPDALYGFLHPLNFLRVKSRQIAVSIEHEQPPVGTNFEEFPNLPVSEAAELMGLNKKGGGVQLSDWSAADQERLKRGEKPLGHPEHPNI